MKLLILLFVINPIVAIDSIPAKDETLVNAYMIEGKLMYCGELEAAENWVYSFREGDHDLIMVDSLKGVVQDLKKVVGECQASNDIYKAGEKEMNKQFDIHKDKFFEKDSLISVLGHNLAGYEKIELKLNDDLDKSKKRGNWAIAIGVVLALGCGYLGGELLGVF